MFVNSSIGLDSAEVEKRRALDAAARVDPNAYRSKVVALAVGGYAAPLLFLLLLIILVWLALWYIAQGGSGGALLLKIFFLVFALAAVIAKSMMIKFDKPQGRRLRQSDAPAVFALAERIRKELKGPPIHEIFLDDQLNAAIQQAPRFGMFGGHINRLIIGLPLMQALSAKEFTAVLAHEYGHLAGSHGKTGAWIYRTRAMWSRLHQTLQEQHNVLSLPLVAFIRRFAPYFDRISFPLARTNEYEADQAAADFTDAQTTADALIRIDLVARYMAEVFWPSANKHAHASPTPNVAPLAHYHEALPRVSAARQSAAWAKSALAQQTDFIDTHPSLADRIAALGADARVPNDVDDPATRFLGAAYEPALTAFDEDWRERTSADWSAAHEQAQTSLARLRDLDEKAKLTELVESEALERAQLAEIYQSPHDAITRFEDAVLWHETNAHAWLQLGRLLATEGQTRCIEHLDRAATLDEKLALAAAFHKHAYYAEIGDEPSARAAGRVIETEAARHHRAEQEVCKFKRRDALEPHGLAESSLAPLIEILNDLHKMKEVFLLKKLSTEFKDYVCYHLIITPDHAETFDYQDAALALRGIPFPTPLCFWFAVENERWMAALGRETTGARIDLN